MGGFISYSSPPFFITCDLIAHTIVMSSYIISPYMGDSPDIVKYLGRIPVHRYHDNEDVFFRPCAHLQQCFSMLS